MIVLTWNLCSYRVASTKTGSREVKTKAVFFTPLHGSTNYVNI